MDVAKLKIHLLLYLALMGLAWLMDAPALIEKAVPDLSSIGNRFDERFISSEMARVQLQMMTNVLNLWQTQDFGALLARSVKKAS